MNSSSRVGVSTGSGSCSILCFVLPTSGFGPGLLVFWFILVQSLFPASEPGSLLGEQGRDGASSQTYKTNIFLLDHLYFLQSITIIVINFTYKLADEEVEPCT